MYKISSCIFFAVQILINSTFAKESIRCTHDNKNFRCVKYIKNYDGDTITFEIPNVHPLIGKNISIRVKGIDTPELKTKNKCEKKKARAAKKLLNKILKNAKRIDLQNVERGKWFRIAANVIVDGKSISSLLLKNGLAYTYHGRTKSTINWCEDLRRPASP